MTDKEAMKLAISEAYRGAGYVSPNPLVGCVVLDSKNNFLSKGYHHHFGEAHAEVNAIRGLSKNQLKDARVFVTLEPCAHEGKTPSCAKMLAQLPIQEVIYGLTDPNPLVSSQGAKIIRDAGIKVTQYPYLKLELEKVCEHFLMNFRQKRPFITLKVASSLDGQLAHANGESQWITSEASRKFAHYLRATHDAVLVGKNTILIDNPKLNIRHKKFPKKIGKIIVIDPKGQILKRPELQIFKFHQPKNILIVTNENLKTDLATVILVKEKLNDAININTLLTQLFHSGIKSVLVEGGALTISSFIMQKEADRLYLFQAPVLIGSRTGKAWSEGVMINSMSEKLSLISSRFKRIGNDLVTTALFPKE